MQSKEHLATEEQRKRANVAEARADAEKTREAVAEAEAERYKSPLAEAGIKVEP